MPLDDRYQALLKRRIRVEDAVEGSVYVIHARNGGVGIAVSEGGRIGYRIHREKFGNHFLFAVRSHVERTGPRAGRLVPVTRARH
jgi:hypothetical protein